MRGVAAEPGGAQALQVNSAAGCTCGVANHAGFRRAERAQVPAVGMVQAGGQSMSRREVTKRQTGSVAGCALEPGGAAFEIKEKSAAGSGEHFGIVERVAIGARPVTIIMERGFGPFPGAGRCFMATPAGFAEIRARPGLSRLHEH